MRPLPLEFRKNTFHYKQILRNETHAVYAQIDNGDVIAYEVFKINKNREFILHGNVIQASESVPSNEQWGVKAWTVRTLDHAKEKFEELTHNKQNI